MDMAEKIIFNKLEKYREKANRERFILPEDSDISIFTEVVDDVINFLLT
jgi:hypothetical protein